MKITKLTLENFRSFKEEKTIEFAPVTLLFGPNSIGKSTVLMALFYIHHMLSKGDCNPLRIEELGDKYVGGFKNLVHGRDLDQTIRIGIEYGKGNTIGSAYTDVIDLLGENELEGFGLSGLADVSSTVEHVAIKIAIDWSAQRKLAYVSECVIKLNDQEYATLKSSSGGQQAFIESINYLHPLLIDEYHDEWLQEFLDNHVTIHSANAAKALELQEKKVPKQKDNDSNINKLIQDVSIIKDIFFVSQFHLALNGDRIPDTGFDDIRFVRIVDGIKLLHYPIAFKNIIGAIPRLGKTLDTTLDFENKKIGALLVEILSDAIVPVFDNLLTLLESSLCIGPLRAIPDPTYQPNPNPQTKDWYDGLAAWDYLEKTDIPLLSKLDLWMQKLALGYGVTIKQEKSSVEYKSLHSFKSAEKKENDTDGMTLNYQPPDGSKINFDLSSPVTKYAIWDSRNNIEVSGCDIGVGVSQILPFIVAAVVKDRGFIAIEQPELHVHPRVQVGIGDLLTQVNKNVGFLVETHSEHLILRLLKRIRQTTDGELPEGMKPVSKEDVAIIYLEASDSGVKTKRIHLDEDGEFQQHWPDGFFAERREELM